MFRIRFSSNTDSNPAIYFYVDPSGSSSGVAVSESLEVEYFICVILLNFMFLIGFIPRVAFSVGDHQVHIDVHFCQLLQDSDCHLQYRSWSVEVGIIKWLRCVVSVSFFLLSLIHVQHEETEESEESEEEEEEAGVRRSSRRTRVQVSFPLKKFSYFFLFGWLWRSSYEQFFGSGFDPNNRVRGCGSRFGIRIRIQEGKNEPQKNWKS